MIAITDDMIETVARMLSNEGADTERAWHGWRCFDTRYPEPCGCNEEVARLVLEAVAPLIAAQAWDEGHRASERDWNFAYDLTTPDADRQPWANPYQEDGHE